MIAQLVACQKLVLLGRLSSNITHEVNNHLTGVTGYAQLLLAQERAQAVARELEMINSSANKCQKLVADFKRIAHFGNREREYDNINFIIRASVELLRNQFVKKSFEIIENYSPDIPPVEVDTPGLGQAFLNIIQNAFEAIEEKGTRLAITTLEEKGGLVAMFEDDGAGLTEEARKHLFTPFFTTKTRPWCLGLGLAATKMLVESHNGSIEIKDRPGGGTCVRVILPCQ